MHSLISMNRFNKNDTTVQMASCSFDVHLEDIFGTLMAGGTLVMLHPSGNMDFHYLSRILQQKQITYIHTVPSLLHSFFIFLQETNNLGAIKYLHTLCNGGE